MNPWYSSLGLVVGITFLLVGFICVGQRHSGNTTLFLEFCGLKVRVKNALPGIIFAILGLLAILITRPD
jgi:hypothetical protein